MFGPADEEGFRSHPDVTPRIQRRSTARESEVAQRQWGDINWRGSYVEGRRSFVGGVVTTPKNHQRRRVDLSRQLLAELRLWRRRERAAWLKKGRAAPPWV